MLALACQNRDKNTIGGQPTVSKRRSCNINKLRPLGGHTEFPRARLGRTIRKEA
jgi:hypothetical protein